MGAAWRSAWWLWEARASAPRISSSMRLAELAAVDRCTVRGLSGKDTDRPTARRNIALAHRLTPCLGTFNGQCARLLRIDH